jgi:hypothetical protein
MERSVGITTASGVDGRASIPVKNRNCFLLHSIQIGSGVQSASFPTGTNRSSLDGKAAQAELLLLRLRHNFAVNIIRN